MSDTTLLADDENGNPDDCESTETPASERDAKRFAAREAAVTSEDAIEVVLSRLIAVLATELEEDCAAIALESADNEAALDAEDDMTALSPIASAKSAHADIVRRLRACVVPPWKVRPSHAAKLLRWQRLSLLDELGCLTGCWRGKSRRCTMQDKRHRGCRDRKNIAADACRRGALLILSQDIGGLDYYASFRPISDDAGNLLPPPEWPSGNNPVARAMVAALWKRYLDRKDAKCGDHVRGRSPKDPPASRVRSTEAPSGTAVERSGRASGEDSRVASWTSGPLHDRHTCNRSAVTKVRVSPAVVGLRSEIGEQGLYVCGLLTSTGDKPTDPIRLAEFKAGWRLVTRAILDRDLGKFRQAGKVTRHSDALLGSRSAPGLLERLGAIERLGDYQAGGALAYSQRYRIAGAFKCNKAALVEVEVTLRKRAKVLPAKRVPAGPPVHPWIVECFTRLALDKDAALRELCASLGLPESAEVAVVLAGIEAMTAPTVRLTSKGKPCKQQDKDPREPARNHANAIAGFNNAERLRRDRKVGRLLSPINGLPSWAAKHLTLDVSPLATLDIRACGLALCAAKMRHSGADSNPDVRTICDMLEDLTRDPYCALFHIAHKREPTPDERDAFKQTALKDLWFSTPTQQAQSTLGEAVALAYPGFSRYLVETKRSRGDKGNAELARETLRAESTLMLETLPAALAVEGIRCATKHDCVFVRVQDRERAIVVFQRVLTAAGIRAVVKG